MNKHMFITNIYVCKWIINKNAKNMKKYVLIMAKQIEKKKELNKIIQLNHINFIKKIRFRLNI